jgi:formylglycine-generating enzyme required for sulfatase activity
VPVPDPAPAADEDDVVVLSCSHCAGEFEVDGPTLAALQGADEFPCPICSQMLPVSILPMPAPVSLPPPPKLLQKKVLLTPSAGPLPVPPAGTGWRPPAAKTVQAHVETARGINRNLLLLGAAAILLLGGLALFLASRPTGKKTVVQEKIANEIVNNKFFQDLITSGVTTETALEALAKVEPDGKGYVGYSRRALTWEEARELARFTGSEVLSLDDTTERTGRQFAEWLAGVFPELHGSTVWVTAQGRERITDLPDILPVTLLERRRPALFSWQTREVPEIVRWRAPDGAVFVTIPAGPFQMGDSLDGDGNAPVIKVNVSAFQMQTTEITKAQWDDVRAWAQGQGYTDLPEGEGRAPEHPVQKINWFDAVKWCNARSERNGLQPCYRVGGEVYRLGVNDAVECDWTANGYRLPTEAEWEKAARGTLVGRRYPWGYTINHQQANFNNSGRETYRAGPTGYHPSYFVRTPPGPEGPVPYTSPAGAFPANDYGLHDMAGNVWEWCWDWYERHQYLESDGKTDPRGPEAVGTHRVLRGGSWYSHAYYTRTAIRVWLLPESPLGNRGFRTVLSGAEPRVARP